MLFLTGVLLAIFVLPSPWGLVAVLVGAVLEITETGTFLWWSQRRRASVGVEALVGREGVVLSDLWPEGQIKIAGEPRQLAQPPAEGRSRLGSLEAAPLSLEPPDHL